jgi:hypothetical protein
VDDLLDEEGKAIRELPDPVKQLPTKTNRALCQPIYQGCMAYCAQYNSPQSPLLPGCQAHCLWALNQCIQTGSFPAVPNHLVDLPAPGFP